MTAQLDVARLLDANPPLIHPGPAAIARRNVVPTKTSAFAIDIPVEENVQDVILAAFEEAGFASGFVTLDGLQCAPLRFVMPAVSTTPERLAWYSDTLAPTGVSAILRGHMSVGRLGADGFTHCHGVWRLSDGTQAMGHLLAHECRADVDHRVEAVGFHNALYDRRPDEETRFDLFAAVPNGEPLEVLDAIAVTLRPNENVMAAARRICEDNGIVSAEVRGIGSLNGAAFLDGGRMHASISEFMIRSGRINASGDDTLDLAVVDVDGNQFAGPAKLDQANVSITAELVILPD
jgi:hypothetical protein